jgi:class 3 adenylate cyclase/tetratricopeptide (TPR) repeat protein
MPSCLTCGHENREGARFCDSCGASLVSELGAGSRRTVTVLFTDVVGSTGLGERLDPERLQALLGRYFDVARDVIERHGGTVEKFIGDAVVAVFGIPRLREDDALRAVRAAVDIREALDALDADPDRVRARTGVHTGEVIVGDAVGGGKLATGDAMNVAARLEQRAGADEILISAATHRLVHDAVQVEEADRLLLKGRDAPVEVYRLLKVDPSALGFARRLTAPMVGRDRELSLLRAAFDRAVSDRACQLFTVLGVGGVGKSRLLGAFVDELDDRATVLRGRCLPYGDGITFWPIIEAVRPAAALLGSEDPATSLAKIAALVPDDDQADKIARQVGQIMGLEGGEAVREETFWAIRRLLEGMARTRPVALVIDDMQWAEPTMLELVEHIADWAVDAPILVACMARPELLEVSPGWGGGKLNATSISLEPLTPADLGSLVANLLAVDRIDPSVRDRIVQAAEGHPLFAEETLAMLVEQGRIVLRDETWVAAGDLAELAVPPTTSALISARIDQLDASERITLHRAAVIGQLFYRDALIAMTGGMDPGRELAALTRKQFVHPESSDLAGSDALAFRHLMIRDAAYEGIPKVERADLHERFADWLERAVADRHVEYDEILGFHLERACRYLEELGQTGDRQRAIAIRAADRFASAARRATARIDLPAAASLLGRAVAVLDEEDPTYPELLWESGVAWNRQGENERASHVLTKALGLATDVGDARLERRVRLDLWWADAIGPHRSPPRDMADQVSRLIPELEGSDDDLGLAKAWQLVAEQAWNAGQVESMREPLAQALVHARLAGDRLEENEARISLLHVDRVGPAKPHDMLARYAEVAAEAAGDRRFEAQVLGCEAVAHAMLGEFALARSLLERYRETIRDLGIYYAEFWLADTTWFVEMLAGDAVAAEAGIRIVEGHAAAQSDQRVEAAVGSRLAHSLYGQGRYEEAGQSLLASRQDPGERVGTRVLWLSASAKVAARRSDDDLALAHAREAVALAETMDDLNLHGDALMDLAEVLSMGGRVSEADPAIEAAIGLFELKGNLVSAARATETLGRASSA